MEAMSNLTPRSSKTATEIHLNLETLGLYLLGDLSVGATFAAEEHLYSCARCKSRLPQMEAVLTALRSPVN